MPDAPVGSVSKGRAVIRPESARKTLCDACLPLSATDRKSDQLSEAKYGKVHRQGA